jgi:hypothetical protein
LESHPIRRCQLERSASKTACRSALLAIGLLNLISRYADTTQIVLQLSLMITVVVSLLDELCFCRALRYVGIAIAALGFSPKLLALTENVVYPLAENAAIPLIQ